MHARSLILALALSAVSAAPSLAADPLAAGHFQVLGGAGGMLVAAPHGGFDLYSDDVARQIALVTGAGYVIASGFRTRERPWNVNRPTSGVGLAPEAEARPEGAARVYEAFRGHVRAGAPTLYVEIHGNSRAASAGWIEVATQGLSPDEARRFKESFLARVSRLDAALPRFDARVEPLDDLHYRASAAKRHGIFKEVPRGVHIEMPWAMRVDERVRSAYAWAIAFSLRELQGR